MEILGLLLLSAAMLILRQNVILLLLVLMAYVHMVWGDGMIVYLIQDMWGALDSASLLAVPLFIISGALMSRGTIAGRLIAVVRAATEWLPGGLGLAAILSCAVFAALSGSSAATLIAVGGVMYPALKEAGYSNRFAIGSVTSAGTLGILIPPSIPLILYGIVTETNIVDLFKAGMLPGLILTLALGAYSVWANRGIARPGFSARILWRATQEGIWALMLPVILLGGIYSGLFTPTEAAAVSVGYAVVVEVVIYRELGWRAFYGSVLSTAQMLGTLFPIVAVALSLKTLMAVEGVPHAFADWLQDNVHSPIVFLIVVNLLLILVGCLIDVLSAILLLGPILYVAAVQFGIDPVHLGIMMIINLEIGLLTPPIGLNLLVAISAFRERFGEICLSVLPFIAIMLAVLALITFVPEVSLIFLR